MQRLSADSVPENELEFAYARSGGPGGQNVNKVETKVRLKWEFVNSRALSPAQKNLLLSRYENGIIALESQKTRSRLQNTLDVLDKFEKLLNKTLSPAKKRVPTKVSRAKKTKRLDAKKRRGAIKKLRSKPDIE